jgi:hypothetical protein
MTLRSVMGDTADTHQINRQRTPPARLRCAIAALVAAFLIAACGSSSPSGTSPLTAAGRATTSSSSPNHPAAATASLAFSKCMRGHGVPNFPDLRGNGMRIAASGQTISVNGRSFSASAFSLARQKCQLFLPHISASPRQAAQQRQQGLKFARCMRGHGVRNFPDPKLSGASGGNNQAARLPGVTDGELQAPAFQAAAKACGGGPKGP